MTTPQEDAELMFKLQLAEELAYDRYPEQTVIDDPELIDAMMPTIDKLMPFIQVRDEQRDVESRLHVLNKLRRKTHGGEGKSQDYIDGYNEFHGKLMFEYKRLMKRANLQQQDREVM